MAFARFYGHFAAAYGTFWLALLLAALLSQSNIDAGEFGLYGFPVLAAIYAFVRMAGQGSRGDEIERPQRRIARLEGELSAR